MTDTKGEAPASLEKRGAALEIVLRRKADMPKNFVAEFTEHADDAGITANGAQMVARAWTDPEYSARMLVDGTAAARELGFEFPEHHRNLVVLENAATVHNDEEDAMKRLVELVVTAAMLTIPAAASAQALTEAQARAAIAPWYQLFNQPVQGDMKTLQEQILTADYESCSGYLPGDCWGRETSIKVVGGFAKSIPDMKFDIKEILVAGDRIVVRGEVTGTPAGDLFGVPHTGKSFRIMAIDIQTIRDGKIARTYHLENWLSALRQLRDK